jgi:MoaA/NifB/PqqE/SkfB family radical SAM enzyme
MNPDGSLYPCCRLGGEAPLGHINDGLENVWKNKLMVEMREKLLAGEKSAYCIQCYNEDESNVRSMRQKVNKRFAHHFDKAITTSPELNLSWIDFRFSNLCNFKCMICGPHLSSTWNDGKVIQPELNIIEELRPHLSQLEAIYFAGGEPLLMQEHYDILDFLIETKKTKTHLSYNSNLSILNYNNQNLLNL